MARGINDPWGTIDFELCDHKFSIFKILCQFNPAQLEELRSVEWLTK